MQTITKSDIYLLRPDWRRIFLIACCIIEIVSARAQPTIYFNKISVDQGLNDGSVETICQDRFGYVWISTMGGINRYNGNSFTFFDRVHTDSGVAPKSICRSIRTDSSGRLFMGFENCLAEFDYNRMQLVKVPDLGDRWVFDFFPVSKSEIILSTNDGWKSWNPVTHDLRSLDDAWGDTSVASRIFGVTSNQGILYILNRNGLFGYRAATKKITSYPFPDSLLGPSLLATDDQNNIWILTRKRNQLHKYHLATHELQSFQAGIGGEEFALNQLVYHPVDQSLWMATVAHGIYRFHPATRSLSNFSNNPYEPWSISSNLVSSIMVDKGGLLWTGGLNGLNIARPSNSYFEIIHPFNNQPFERNRQIARYVTEDANNKLWFATVDGVSVLDSNLDQTAEFNNRVGKPDQIYYNSVRGVVKDSRNRIWIATGRGVNRFDNVTGKMEFLGPGDSLINGFYFGTFKDHTGKLWFCCRDGAGLFWYDEQEDKIYSINAHPVLKALSGLGFRYITQDSRDRYWIGHNGAGVSMYDPHSGALMRWQDVADSLPAIAGSYIIDIKEDKNGKIWVSSFSGLSMIDPDSRAVKIYTRAQGLLSNTVSSLGVDNRNRLWIGTSRGLMVLDSSRQHFSTFNQYDGLPHVSFNEHAGYTDHLQRFIFPTFNGFIRFDPLRYNDSGLNIPYYLSGVSVGQQYRAIPITSVNDTTLRLRYYNNAVTFHMQALYYEKPDGAWYAYRLNGFEKEWHYSQEPNAVYTNIPGGSYQFEYKVASNNTDWNRPHKSFSIHIGTVFYKTIWFWLLVALAAGAGIYQLYQSRLSKQRQFLSLQSKTQALEKEKAMVMYENLKEHLNPHFLFNSLTSLGSLIRLDQDMAGDFLERMSKIYRYILKNRDSETVTLRDEIDFVQTFITLQKTRFEEALQVRITVSEEELHRKIAPVTLQNLVENAIKHNTISRQKPLLIDIYLQEDYLVVRNNLQRKSFVETSNKQGLQNMKSLYRYLSALPFLIEEDTEYFRVLIPLL